MALAELWIIWKQRLYYATWILRWLVSFRFLSSFRSVASPKDYPSSENKRSMRLDTVSPGDIVVDVRAAYHNSRLDSRNYLEGPLSTNPSTRLRQLLARPGIIVCPSSINGWRGLF